MKNNIRNILCGLLLSSVAVIAPAQAQIPVIGVLIPADLILPGLDALPGLDGLRGLDALGSPSGDILGPHGTNGIPVVGALISGAAVEGIQPVLATIVSPEFLTNPSLALNLLSADTVDAGSTLVLAILGGVTTKLPLPELPGL